MLQNRRAALIMAATLPALAGCVQATRHSNTMVFGTNTNVGLKAGQNASQIPEVSIGYQRQEAVLMPLLANTSEKSDNEGRLSPCSLAEETKWSFNADGVPTGAEQTNSQGDANVIHPCKFVGIRKSDEDFLIQDSYSVLASFGARIEGKGSTGEGAVGLAQYFATGAAAQTLALTGGASVVAVGKAAEDSSKNSSGAANAAAALTGADPVAATSTSVTEFRSGELQPKLFAYLDASALSADELMRRYTVAGEAASKVGFGSSLGAVTSLVAGGSDEDHAKLIGAIKALETSEDAKKLLD